MLKDDNFSLKYPSLKVGYYLVLPSNDKYFISKNVNVKAWENLCNLHLNEKNNWQYKIKYYFGLDNLGREIWSDWDMTDKFIDADQKYYGYS